jgi:hypothetical protein
MTLIATVISKYGIIQASDSNKMFHLGFTDGMLALAGVSSVDGRNIDSWIPACIGTFCEFPQPTLSGFAKYVAGRLGTELRVEECQEGGAIQIGGYASHPPGVHPELWSVQNENEIEPNGAECAGIGRTWRAREEFWDRDYRKIGSRLALASGFYCHYFSGIAPGRVAFSEVSQLLHDLFQQVWQHETWKFRAPRTLDELASIVELSIRAVGTLYRCSDYPVPYVGGDVQVEKLAPPPNAVEL